MLERARREDAHVHQRMVTARGEPSWYECNDRGRCAGLCCKGWSAIGAMRCPGGECITRLARARESRSWRVVMWAWGKQTAEGAATALPSCRRNWESARRSLVCWMRRRRGKRWCRRVASTWDPACSSTPPSLRSQIEAMPAPPTSHSHR